MTHIWGLGPKYGSNDPLMVLHILLYSLLNSLSPSNFRCFRQQHSLIQSQTKPSSAVCSTFHALMSKPRNISVLLRPSNYRGASTYETDSTNGKPQWQCAAVDTILTQLHPCNCNLTQARGARPCWCGVLMPQCGPSSFLFSPLCASLVLAHSFGWFRLVR